MNRTATVLRSIGRAVSAALGEGIDTQVNAEGIATGGGLILPTVLPDGISPPESLISGYSWVALDRSR